MPRFEYKLVPAPEKATKHKGLKGAANFAATLEDVMNSLGAEGWHYLRADILPQEERSGLTSKTTVYRNLLVFQRVLPEETAAPPETRTRATEESPAPDGESTDEPSLAYLFLDPDAARPP
jgi:hypothetical protein